jgi:hypothetical protein
MNPEPMDRVSDASLYVYSPRIATAAPDRPQRAELIVHSRWSSRRADVEAFVRAAFHRHFGAELRHFMPTLLATYEPNGDVRAAVGIRSAAIERLFLETYTRRPIEDTIAARLGAHVPRTRIVEVGSLACRNGRAAMEIVIALVPWLLHAGFSWVAFTGADTVLNVFKRLKLEPQALCVADKTLLGDAQYEWGSYYDHEPVVMAGRLADGLDVLDSISRAR